MPGITGFFSKTSKEQNEIDLQLMISSMRYEKFYNYGSYVNKDLGIYLGWVCHKESFVDCMPIWNEKKDKCLFFYGENFADRELVDILKQNGHDFNPNNASYLVHLFEEKGDTFYSHLNGFFHGILIDFLRKEVILFNDRYGMQRVYYYENKERFMFSSEAKTLLKACPELREIVPASLGQLLSLGCVLGNNTLYKNVYLLSGGSLVRFNKGKCEKKDHYFTPNDWENQNPLGKETFYKALKEKFIKILPRYLNDFRPIGMSLTGGLDTRIIMAHIHRPPATLPCYTFGSIYHDGFDVKIARKVAKICKQKHSTIKVDREFIRQFPSLAEKTIYISDGNLDAASGATELYINKKAREIAPIRITGNYGSEVLRNIRSFGFKPPNKNLFEEEINININKANQMFKENTEGHKLSFTLFKQAPWFNYNRVSVEQSQLTTRTPYMDNELTQLIYMAPQEAVTNDNISLQLVRDGNPELSKIITNRGAGGNFYGLLTKSIQVYYEILHLAEIGYDYGMPHWLSSLDYYLRPFHLEKIFLGRNNFYHFRIWFRNELSEYLQEILLDRRTINRSYLNKGFLEKLVKGHIKGEFNYSREINKMLTVELIHRVFIDNT